MSQSPLFPFPSLPPQFPNSSCIISSSQRNQVLVSPPGAVCLYTVVPLVWSTDCGATSAHLGCFFQLPLLRLLPWHTLCVMWHVHLRLKCHITQLEEPYDGLEQTQVSTLLGHVLYVDTVNRINWKYENQWSEKMGRSRD